LRALADNAAKQEVNDQMPRAREAHDDAASAAVTGTSSVARLDPQALQRLRELDPTGAGKLMERLAKAFDASVARLLPQLLAAQAAGEAAGIRHVAHTLKSPSASIGAVKLSRMCAEMELMARQGRTDGMDEKVAALSTELSAVQAALKDALVSSP
jgi:HPt (histidine-containing phosphotransfer) domain-containing protein